MNWEETIVQARQQEQFQPVIRDAYLEADLVKNVTRFGQSTEFRETLRLLKKYGHAAGAAVSLLEIGAGNGISSINFALSGYRVTAVEPDPSATLGSAAILQLKQHYQLTNMAVAGSFGEALPFADGAFDIVYARQALHHAAHLNNFVSEAARVLKPGGIVMTCRDHVVNDQQQKEEFLQTHPFHKTYGGENAFTLEEYRSAFAQAGLKIALEAGPLDSEINLNPRTRNDYARQWLKIIQAKTGIALPSNRLTANLVVWLFKTKTHNFRNEAGRLYSFVALKPGTRRGA